MNLAETAQLIKFARSFQRIDETDELARAWYLALDERMPAGEALACAARLAGNGDRITPGSLNKAWLAEHAPAHQQGASKPHLPGQVTGRRPRREPLRIGAPDPVRPDDVPGYRAARRKVQERAAIAADRAEEVRCSWCGAEAGQPCVDPQPKRAGLRRFVHPTRRELASTSRPW